MSARLFARRAVAALTLTASVALLAPLALAHPGPIGGVRVDVGPLLANSGEPTAAWVARELPGALAAALASSGQAGPVSVRIDYVLLRPDSAAWLNGWAPDQIIGEVTRGGVTQPLTATAPYLPSPVNNAMVEQSNHQRVSRLVDAFAGWVARGY